MKNTTLKIVRHILVIAVALFTLNGLSFSLTAGDTGFYMLTFSSSCIGEEYEWGLVLIGIFCWFQFLFSLAAVALSIISIFIKKESTAKSLSMMALIGGVVFCFLYMLEGSIEAAICNATYRGGGFTTTAFIPFLLNVVLMITYFILPNFAKSAPNNMGYYPGYENFGYDANHENAATKTYAGEDRASGMAQSAPSASKDIDSAIFYIRSYISDENVMSLRNALVNSNATDLSFISLTPLKNPMTVLLFSIFLGGCGVDRFYIGDTGLGVAKLLLSVFTLGIWPLVDIFLCYKKAKEQNYNNLMQAIRHNSIKS